MKNIMNFGIAIIILACIPNNAHSQEVLKKFKNNVQLEAFGHGLMYSVNYERSLFELDNLRSTFKVGISKYDPNKFITLWIPISFNTQIKIEQNHWLEVGCGKIINDDGKLYPDGNFESKITFEKWIFRLGYNYDFNDGKFLFKVAYTPILEGENAINQVGSAFEQFTSGFHHWGGISFGCRF